MNRDSNPRIFTLRGTNMAPRMRPNRRFALRRLKKDLKVGFRAFRFVLLVLSFLLCIWQVSVCLGRFVTEPISTTVVMESHFDNYTFPPIIACPNKFLLLTLPDWRKMNISLDVLWKTNDLKDSRMLQMCEEAINPDCGKSHLALGTPIDTVQGYCHKFENKNVYRYTGTDSGQFLIAFPRMANDSSAQLFLSTKVTYRYNLQHDKLTHKPLNYIYYTVTEFQNINSYRNPCWPEDDVMNCLNSCMDKLLRETNIKCRLPFHQGDVASIPPCTNSLQTIKYEVTYLNNAYLKLDTCKCGRACTSVIYSTVVKSLSDVEHTSKLVTILITVPKTIVSEFYSYPFSSMAAEVLSNVGFFLGISMISIVDFILQTFKMITTTVQKIKRSLKPRDKRRRQPI